MATKGNLRKEKALVTKVNTTVTEEAQGFHDLTSEPFALAVNLSSTDKASVFLQTSNLADDVTASDRRLLLAASFRLFLRRLSHGILVRRSDLARLADFGERDAEPNT